MQKKVFICHSSQDKEIADIICSSLENAGIGCWIAPRDIPYGSDWAGTITDAIKASRVFVFLLTKNSNNSHQCPKEINIADNSNIPMICITGDNVVPNSTLEYYFSSKQQAIMIDVSQIKMRMEQIIDSINGILNGVYQNNTRNEHSSVPQTRTLAAHPCKFCGMPAEMIQENRAYFVQCTHCKATGTIADTENKAIVNWIEAMKID